MTRWAGQLALAVAVALVAALVAQLGYGWAAARQTFVVLAPLSCGIVLVVALLLAQRERVGGLRVQAGLTALVAAIQFAAATALFISTMYVSSHDALLTALLAADAVVLTAWAAHQLGRRALADVEAIRATLGAVAEGRRDVRTGVRGRDELARLAADVDATIDRLEGEERARRTMIAGVSHDLRTPITSLRLLADAIDDEIGDAATRREYAARMSTHVSTLTTLIDDLFELTRLETGELTWSLEQVRLDELVRETVEAMRPAAAASAVAVSFAPAAPATVQANPERVQRVLLNLIQNAIHHTPPDGSVTVRAEPTPDGAEVEVADTGTGIATEHRARVFDPFFRADAARSETRTGLGLAISRAIVEAHGGRIWLADAPVGTRVRFHLPATAPDEAAPVGSA